MRDDSWRGGFLLSALEMYLKNDMRSKFHFLNDVDVAVGFTSTMMAQATYSGTTTIVPDTCLRDYFLVRCKHPSISLYSSTPNNSQDMLFLSNFSPAL